VATLALDLNVYVGYFALNPSAQRVIRLFQSIRTDGVQISGDSADHLIWGKGGIDINRAGRSGGSLSWRTERGWAVVAS